MNGTPGLERISSVWQVVWGEVNGNPSKPITRKKVQTGVGNIPEAAVLGCLISFVGEGLIKCVNDKGEDFDPKKNSDYDVFRLTHKGSSMGNLYTKT